MTHSSAQFFLSWTPYRAWHHELAGLVLLQNHALQAREPKQSRQAPPSSAALRQGLLWLKAGKDGLWNGSGMNLQTTLLKRNPVTAKHAYQKPRTSARDSLDSTCGLGMALPDSYSWMIWGFSLIACTVTQQACVHDGTPSGTALPCRHACRCMPRAGQHEAASRVADWVAAQPAQSMRVYNRQRHALAADLC